MSQMQKENVRALKNAVASVEMEGYTVSEEEKKLCMQVLTGELSKEKFIAQMLERCRL